MKERPPFPARDYRVRIPGSVAQQGEGVNVCFHNITLVRLSEGVLCLYRGARGEVLVQAYAPGFWQGVQPVDTAP